MSEMRTEEEQIQAIKDWWKENGSSLLIGIGAALAIIFGWQAWQNYQTEQHTAAANEFVTLLSAHSGQDGETNKERTETVAFVAQKLRDNYSGSAYAIYGNLILAQQQLQDGDATSAIESLKWAQEKAGDHKALSLVVRNRLARAQFSAEHYDDALATIGGVSDGGAFSPIFSELKGDILLAKGDKDGARKAYLAAREQQAQQGQQGGVLGLKLADLGVGGDA
ncbi:MAG TPA: tetratricopeptide repeat protein [Marinobacter sp.]|nr:tetratricopeptide repeat protein [Marinobacter sp.]